MMSSITYLRHDLLSSLLIRPARTQGACQFPHSRAMSDAAYSSSAAVAANAAVAADAQPAPMDQGGMVKAMALRVKYRATSESGRAKRRSALHRLGVHPGDRGGVYPQEDTVQHLGVRLAREGFLQEEADHGGICVESAVADDDAGAETYTTYNRRKTGGSVVLGKCFPVDAQVSYGMLSHNHLLLVLLCWQMNAVWNLSKEECRICGVHDDGRLDLELAAGVKNLGEMIKCCLEGLWVEVLSWKIDTEEPGGCALISNALNNTNEVALRTTELTAVAVLSGECALQSNALNSNSIDFEAIKKRLHLMVPTFVAEPEFKEFFDCIINLGADKATLIPELLDFGSKFVNQKAPAVAVASLRGCQQNKHELPKGENSMSQESLQKTTFTWILPHTRGEISPGGLFYHLQGRRDLAVFPCM